MNFYDLPHYLRAFVLAQQQKLEIRIRKTEPPADLNVIHTKYLLTISKYNYCK